MTEKLLQFIWQFGYFNNTNLTTTDSEKLSILFAGNLNTNGGPDFSAAKIRIGETTFFGNIELHLKTSDWEKHGHESDRQYGNVILHVVFRHDKQLGHAIPVLELESRISSVLLQRYADLMHTENFIPCGSSAASVPELVWIAWKERLLAERLARKSGFILDLLEQNNYHWEETFWWLLARNFGMKVNSDAFEAVARLLSITQLAKHKHSIHQLEALLFGQAGLLQTAFEDDYPRMLQREYAFLQKKLSLQPVSVPLQFLRMRPGNFPTIRLSQLAALIQQSSHIFSRVLEAGTLAEVSLLFEVTANDFWHYHYTFHLASPFKPKTLGAESIQNIIINTIAPVLFAYGMHHGQEEYKDKALRWLAALAVEKNSITRGFAHLGIESKTAFDSQALIELKNEYCSHKKCLHCAVGNNILKREAYRAAEPTLGNERVGN
ncbi:MAG TPA: DUF2851 family protein [Flavisolibacter sp.]|jgi:hypothetical protein|nr:DUF2851 family protein [Flavisolibacter sp.]